MNNYSDLDNILGIGPKLTDKLYKKYKIINIQQLKNNKDALKLLSDTTIKCLNNCYFGKYTRNTIDVVYKSFINKLNKINMAIPLSVLVGSYRRLSPDSNDIDILFIGSIHYIEFPDNIIWLTKNDNSLKRLSFLYPIPIKSLKSDQIINNKTQGTRIIKGKTYLNVKIDIFNTDIQSLPFALLHYTGSFTENIRLRKKAEKLGYKLNQYGLYHKKNNLLVNHKFDNEEDIYKFLKIEYKTPNLR